MTFKYSYQIQFGTFAIEKGIITGGQLGEAVSVQMNEDLKEMKHRLLGQILIDLGYMTLKQVEEVLETILEMD